MLILEVLLLLYLAMYRLVVYNEYVICAINRRKQLNMYIRYRSTITSFLHACTRVAPRGFMRVNAKISRGNYYLYETGTCNLHETGNATTRHCVVLHEAWFLLLHT